MHEPLGEKRLRLECEKLEAERDALRKKEHRKPTFWLTAVAVVAGLLGTVGQAYLSNIKLERAQLTSERSIQDASRIRDQAITDADRAQREMNASRVKMMELEQRRSALLDSTQVALTRLRTIKDLIAKRNYTAANSEIDRAKAALGDTTPPARVTDLRVVGRR